jgi:hypothetical protein
MNNASYASGATHRTRHTNTKRYSRCPASRTGVGLIRCALTGCSLASNVYNRKCSLASLLMSLLTGCGNSVRPASDAHSSDAPTRSSTKHCSATTHWTLDQHPTRPSPASPVTSPKLSTSTIENKRFIFSKAPSPASQAQREGEIPNSSPPLQPLLKHTKHQVFHLVHVC